MSRVSIVIPCFNEEGVIESTIKEIVEYVQTNCFQFELELIVVDDGSEDTTPKVIEQLRSQFPALSPIFFEENKGRGAAMKAGIAASTGDFVITMDADLSYSTKHILKILNTFKDDPKCDAVVISPYMRGGRVANIPFSRLILSRCANYILSGYFRQGFSTVTCMVRGYRGEVIRSLPVLYDSKEIHLEILRKLMIIGAEVREVPGELIWRDAKSRAGRMNKKKVFHSARKHMLYGFLSKPTRFISTFGALLLFFGLYEVAILATLFVERFKLTENSLSRDMRVTFSDIFAQSPHSAILAAVS